MSHRHSSPPLDVEMRPLYSNRRPNDLLPGGDHDSALSVPSSSSVPSVVTPLRSRGSDKKTVSSYADRKARYDRAPPGRVSAMRSGQFPHALCQELWSQAVSIVVSDTSPLRALAHLRLLRVLPDL